VVLCDGSLAGLVALAIEAERADSAPLVLAGDLLGGMGPEEAEVARDAVQAQSRIYQATRIEGAFLLGGASCSEQSPALLTAARIAACAGKRRLVWSVQYPYIGTEPDLDTIATTTDRALLVSRLASLDLWDDPASQVPEVRVETPLIDLSDEQIADFAADLGVPWNTLWWRDASGACARANRERWSPVCEPLGLVSHTSVA